MKNHFLRDVLREIWYLQRRSRRLARMQRLAVRHD